MDLWVLQTQCEYYITSPSEWNYRLGIGKDWIYCAIIYPFVFKCVINEEYVILSSALAVEQLRRFRCTCSSFNSLH